MPQSIANAPPHYRPQFSGIPYLFTGKLIPPPPPVSVLFFFAIFKTDQLSRSIKESPQANRPDTVPNS
jgi:hypothetical protein